MGKNKYFVWKDRNCNGVNPEWIEMNGKEFMEFVKLPENKDRLFIKEYWNPDDESEGYFKSEVTREMYNEWNRKLQQTSYDVYDYRPGKWNPIKKTTDISEAEDSNEYTDIGEWRPTVISLESYATEDGEETFHDIIPDKTANVEDSTISSLLFERVLAYVSTLTTEEKQIFALYYKSITTGISEREISRQNCIDRDEFRNQRNRILKKIRVNFTQT